MAQLAVSDPDRDRHRLPRAYQSTRTTDVRAGPKTTSAVGSAAPDSTQRTSPTTEPSRAPSAESLQTPAWRGRARCSFRESRPDINGEHVNVLSAGRRYKGVVTADLRDIDEQSLMLANMFPATTPLHHRNDSRKPEQGVGPEPARRSAGAGDRDRRRLAARTVAGPPRPRAHRPSRRQSQPRARRRAPTITGGDAPRRLGR